MSCVAAALTQRLQMSVADARSDLQRHSSTLRSSGPSSLRDTSALRDAAGLQHTSHLRSPDRTSLATPRSSASSPRIVSTTGRTAGSSPRIASLRPHPSPPTSGVGSSYSAAGALWSSPRQGEIKRVGATVKRLPQSPTQLQSVHAIQESLSQRHFSSIHDTDSPRWQ